MPGFNSKLSEIGALLALAKLREFDGIVTHRAALAEVYRANLPGWIFQRVALLPERLHSRREAIFAELVESGTGVAKYFSPHLTEQAHFKQTCVIADLTTTEHVSQRILSLPLFDSMSTTNVEQACEALGKVAGLR
jgi:dTDP-4-amino-4,6-dideoxygalactose transaminase